MRQGGDGQPSVHVAADDVAGVTGRPATSIGMAIVPGSFWKDRPSATAAATAGSQPRAQHAARALRPDLWCRGREALHVPTSALRSLGTARRNRTMPACGCHRHRAGRTAMRIKRAAPTLGSGSAHRRRGDGGVVPRDGSGRSASKCRQNRLLVASSFGCLYHHAVSTAMSAEVG